MSSKSQLNKMSKKEILQSLVYQQQQDVSTINRMLVALARVLQVKPEDLAKNFVDQEGNRKFADELNSSMDAAFAQVPAAGQDQPADDSVSDTANTEDEKEIEED